MPEVLRPSDYGICLPSENDLTTEDEDYICEFLEKYLKLNRSFKNDSIMFFLKLVTQGYINMKRAIVAGSTGFIGSALVKVLLEKGIHVLALGRKPLTSTSFSLLAENHYLTYVKIDNSNINDLSSHLTKLSWKPEDACVFYNFSWVGSNCLTDGGFEEQFSNVIHAVEMVKIAKELGCSKFISVGSQEETLMEKYLEGSWKEHAFDSPHDIYAVAKISCRDQSKLSAYLNKIDFIHTTFSVPICEKLEGKGYPNSTLKKIYHNEKYDLPVSSQLFDFIPLLELARAYYLIGMSAENKSEYYIGSGAPRTLSENFLIFSSIIEGKNIDKSKNDKQSSEFNVGPIAENLGFELKYGFEDIIKKMRKI